MSVITVLFITMLAASSVCAGVIFEDFALTGYGNFMNTQPGFLGDIIGGTLSPGTFWIKIDATGWPDDDPETPNNERWDHIFSNYFVYDNTPGGEGWDGYFPPVASGEPLPEWRFRTVAGDTLGGECSSFIVTMRDYNGNGILEDGEYDNKTFAANLIAHINFSTGCFESFCGSGSCSGTIDLVNEETWEEEIYVPSAASASGDLMLNDMFCTTGVESKTWSGIKAIHRD